MLAGH
jgi:hypothetical protein